ncbi:MAG: 50S ribosomal protein L24 [Deltaproteobacteria bacterium]|nr:50S ribosomal protein L24 [Deltaproteobacteria bacterium]
MLQANLGLKKGDTVVVTTGKDRGKRGKIIQIVNVRQKVLVEKVNIVKRHLRQDSQGGGGIMEKESPIHVSNVSYLCQKCDAPVKIMKKILDNGNKVRACAKCGEIIDR